MEYLLLFMEIGPVGWLPVILSGTGAFLLYKAGHVLLAALATAGAVGCFWSWGVMHNYAAQLAKRRPDYTGKFYDLTDHEAEAVPDWITLIAFAFALEGLVLLIVGIIITLRRG